RPAARAPRPRGARRPLPRRAPGRDAAHRRPLRPPRPRGLRGSLRALRGQAHGHRGRVPAPRPARARLMAKPRPVEGLDASKRLRPNARRILAVRIDEVWSYEHAVLDPAAVTELHDMRIAFKRLRYLIEIFGLAFEEDLKPYLERVK